MKVRDISQSIAFSREGPTFTGEIHGLTFTQGICGPVDASAVGRLRWVGCPVIEAHAGDELVWEHGDTGWTLSAIPARDDVPMERLIVIDPDNLPAELPDALMAVVKLYDLRSGKRRGA